MKKKPVMKDVAAAAGVSLMTVSYALRRHPSIPTSTADRIHQVAEALGYRGNPLVSALMTQIRERSPGSGHVGIAYLSSYSDRRSMLSHPFRRAFFEGAVARSEQLGFSLELFCAQDLETTPPRSLSDVLRYRNMHGIIMGISPMISPPIGIDWNQFAGCVIGYSQRYPGLHQVETNYFSIVAQTIERVREHGYSKIGFLCASFENERVGGSVVGGVEAYNSRNKSGDRVDITVMSLRQWNAAAMLAWIRKHRIDALVIQSYTPYRLLLDAGVQVPNELAVASIELMSPRESQRGLSGVDIAPFYVGTAAVNLIADELHHNRRGIPAVRKAVLLDGTWKEGETLLQKCH